jgi:hypothetical protein
LKTNCGIAVVDTLAIDIVVDDKGIKFAVTDKQTQRLSEWPIWTNSVLLFTFFPMQIICKSSSLVETVEKNSVCD